MNKSIFPCIKECRSGVAKKKKPQQTHKNKYSNKTEEKPKTIVKKKTKKK